VAGVVFTKAFPLLPLVCRLKKTRNDLKNQAITAVIAAHALSAKAAMKYGFSIQALIPGMGKKRIARIDQREECDTNSFGRLRLSC
jgi:hypothetical protein